MENAWAELGLDSTYEGLKRRTVVGQSSELSSLDSTYEGLKLIKLIELGALQLDVWTVPMGA